MRAQKSPELVPEGLEGGLRCLDRQGRAALTENLKVTAYALTNGNIGFYLLGNPVPLNKTLEGKVVKGGRGLNVVIDPDVYQPAPGLFTGITKLEVKFKATAKVKGKTIGIVQTTKCPKSKKWNFTFQNVLLGGGRSTTRRRSPAGSHSASLRQST